MTFRDIKSSLSRLKKGIIVENAKTSGDQFFFILDIALLKERYRIPIDFHGRISTTRHGGALITLDISI